MDDSIFLLFFFHVSFIPSLIITLCNSNDTRCQFQHGLYEVRKLKHEQKQRTKKYTCFICGKHQTSKIYACQNAEDMDRLCMERTSDNKKGNWGGTTQKKSVAK